VQWLQACRYIFGRTVAFPIRRKIQPIPRAKRRDVTRGEYNALVDLLNERGRIIDGILRNLELQFQRMAQIQAELDEVRATSRVRKRKA